MNARERGVSERVKLVRDNLGWTQADFSKAIGIRRSKLACIEYGHTPLRYKSALDLCSVFDINGEWLITGKGEMHGSAPGLWVAEFPLEKHGKKLFTEVYDTDPRIFIHVTRVFGLPEGPTPGFDAERFLLAYAVQWFNSVTFKTPAEAERFVRDVNDFAKQSLQEMQRRGEAIGKRTSREIAEHYSTVSQMARKSAAGRKFICKSLLDTLPPFPHTAGVQDQIRDLNGLIERLKKVTAPRGAKAALAREFKVTRQAVNQWLSGESNPSADLAIRLQYWKPKLPAK
jgi:transcriptional regulator with XRE-family HTH domain